MKTIFYLFFLFVILIFTACDDSDSKCSKNSDCSSDKVCSEEGKCIEAEINPTITFYNVNDGMYLNAYEYDEDATQEGIQISIIIKTQDINDDTDITLQIRGQETKEVITKISSSRAVFRAVSLDSREVTLVAKSKDKYGREITSDEIKLTTEDYNITITSPIADLKQADDANPDKFYIQKDVNVEVSGVNEGVTVKLAIYDNTTNTLKTQQFGYVSNKVVVFNQIDFPEGEWKLIASFRNVNNVTIESTPVIIKAEKLPGQCNVSVTPATGQIINLNYLAQDSAIDKNVNLKVTSNCPAGFTVKFIANGTNFANDILRSIDGVQTAETVYTFPENKDNNGDSTFSVEVYNELNTSEGGIATAQYSVDTIAPNFTAITFPEANYEFFPGNDRDTEAEGMQLIVSGTTDDCVGNLVVNDQIFTSAIGSDNSFNTQNLTSDKYVDVITSGENILTFKCSDFYENETTFQVPVTVYLENLILAFDKVGTQSVSEDNLKINQSHDEDTDLNNVQLSITATTDGFDAGRLIALYIDDAKRLESAIQEDKSLLFELNTAELGLSDGIHTIYLQTIELNGPKSQTITLYVSNTKPTILISNYTNGDFTNVQPINLDVVTSGLSGDEEKVYLNVNNIDITSLSAVEDALTFSNVALIEGENTIKLTASDFEGNQADPVNLVVNYDSIVPNIVINSPSNGASFVRTDDTNSTLAGIQINVNVSVPNEIEGTTVKLYLNNNLYATKLLDNAHNVIFNDVTLISGSENTLKVEAIDKATNTADTSVAVNVNDGCYSVQFIAPTINSANLNATSFTGIVNLGPAGATNNMPDGLNLNLKVNSNSAGSTSSLNGGGSFSGVILQEGSNNLLVEYSVDAETNCSLTVSVNYDTQIPVVSNVEFIDKNEVSKSFASGSSPVLGTLYDRGAAVDSQLRTKVTVTGVESGDLVKLTINATEQPHQTVSCVANVCTAVFNFPLTDNTISSLSYVVTDKSNNNSTAYTLNTKVDLITPTVAFIASFPVSLNNSPTVDTQSTVSGLQYNVGTTLTNVQAGDIVKFYINGTLAKMRLNSNLGVEVDAIGTLTEGQTTYTFQNVTFILSPESGYEIKLTIEDSAQNTNQAVKNPYKVLTGLTVAFFDSQYLTQGLVKTNTSPKAVRVNLNRFERGTLNLDVVFGGNTTAQAPKTINLASDLPYDFNVTLANDGRYTLIPKFTDQSNFLYTGETGYLAVKKTAPTKTSYTITQDVNSDGKLIKSEDKNAGLAGFQGDITVNLANVYLDVSDSTLVSAKLRQTDFNGTILSTKTVPANGIVTFNDVTFPEGIYPLVVEVTDNFNNTISTVQSVLTASLTVDTNVPAISSMTGTKTSDKYFANDVKFLVVDDINTTTIGLQTQLKANVSGADSVRVYTTPAGFDQTDSTIVAGVADFGTVTIPDGTYTFTIEARDNAGNLTTTTYTNIMIDTLAPLLNLVLNGTSPFDDTDDVDAATPGFQISVTVNNMQNIEVGQTVSIQSDFSGSYSTVGTFTKTASNTNTLNITLSSGSGNLKAIVSDINTNTGESNIVPLTVTFSNCAVVSVKRGTKTLSGSEMNYFNSSDVSAGNVTLTIETTPVCSGYTLIAERNGSQVGSSVPISSTSTNMTVPFANGDIIVLSFTVQTVNAHSSNYNVTVDTTVPAVSRNTPVAQNITYVNSSNTTVNGTTILGDVNDSTAGAQFTITFNVSGAIGGTIQMISNDGTTDTDQGTLTVSADGAISFTGKTISTDKTHTIKAKVTDIAGNITEQTLYNAVVDVVNPGNLSAFTTDVLTETERRTAEITLNWNQSLTGDDADLGNLAKYVVKYKSTSFTAGDFETLTGASVITINTPDLTDSMYTQVLSNLIFNKNYTIAVRAYDELNNASDVVILSTGTSLNLVEKNLAGTFDSSDAMAELKNIGDVNSDGFDDFAVSQIFASGYDGVVYIYYGTGDADTLTAPQVLEGVEGSFESLGSCLTSADFNGDGRKDLVVGAFYNGWYSCDGDGNGTSGDDWGCYQGGVYVYYNQGNGTPINASEFTFIKNSDLAIETNLKQDATDYKSGKLGISCNFVGDLNADGKEDIIIGESNSKYSAGSQSGRAFVLKGRSGKPAEIDLASDFDTIKLIHNFGNSSDFGYSVNGIGNIDKAGSFDVAVASPASQRVVLYHLTSTSTGTISSVDASSVVLSPAGGVETDFGSLISKEADLNNDTNPDLIIQYVNGVLIYYGTGSKFLSTKTHDAVFSVTGISNFSVGDFNGDLRMDVIAGAGNLVNIYLSKTTNFTIGDTIQPDVSYSGSAFSPALSGTLKVVRIDINDDGIEDFAICDISNLICTTLY